MKILFLNHEYPPIGGGGGVWTQDICRILNRRGHHIKVITSHMHGLPKREQIDGVSIIRLRSLRKEYYRASFLSMGFYIIRSFICSMSIIRRWRPDIIQAVFAVPAGVVGFLINKLTGIPYVISAHLGDVPGGVPDKTDKWFRWIFPFTVSVIRNAKTITAVSSYTGSLLQQSYKINPIIIPNGYDPDSIPEHAVQVNRPPVVVFAGRFVVQKNLVELVEIMASLKDVQWQCKLIGDGPLRKTIEETITTYGLSDRFIITGWLPAEQVVDHLRSSDLLLMPSLSEGQSIVGINALASGLAIVAYNVGGFDELVVNGMNGILVKPGEKQKMSAELRTYLENPDKLLKARMASLNHAKRFDLNRIVDSYKEIYQNVTEANKRTTATL
jgi:L-malate glycosyltransferase